jgi:competence protein ComEC
MAGGRVASKQPVVRTRADIIVTPRFAPLGCAAAIVIDREKLKQTGALTLAFAKDGVVDMRAARAADEDRPWSPAPKRRWGRALPFVAAKDAQGRTIHEEPEPGEGAYASPLD